MVLAIAACKLLLYFYTGRRYGYFVDELYYLACSRHLAWGYVDQPPLIALIAWLVRVALGQSLRGDSSVAGAGRSGGSGADGADRSRTRREALCTSAGCPGGAHRARHFGRRRSVYDERVRAAVLDGLRLSADPHDQNRKHKAVDLVWRFGGIRSRKQIFDADLRRRAGAGADAEQRAATTASRWLWVGGAIALLIFLPNLIWNVQHHFPFLELQANIRASGRDVPLGPLAFFGQEILLMHPADAARLVGRTVVLLSHRGRKALSRDWMGLDFRGCGDRRSESAGVLPVSCVSRCCSRAAACCGSTGWRGRDWHGLRFAYPVLMLLGGALLAPLAIPVLPPETYIRYTKAIGLEQPHIETHKLGPLPQIFADQFGWEEMAATVARVYNSLPPEVRARTAIFAQTYGQAGAIDLFGPKYGLPPAISGHQSYFLWGPRGYTGESMIVMDDRKENLERLFTSVQKVAHVDHPYSMPYEHFDVFYCRGLHEPLARVMAAA